MDEKRQILYMQVRLVRRASETWGMSIKEANEIFTKYDVYRYIERFFEIFHAEGDRAVFADVEEYIRYEETKHGKTAI